jgi:crotonobetainyl-CoA:carnitine CoA-transferase CaiB-like acyl-CoA transferase
MHSPLENIRVLEWAIYHAGPGGPAILGDLGAEVIKIERPGMGDPARPLMSFKEADFRFAEGRNLFYEGANRGKKSITIDLGHEKGREVAYKLIRKSDVFVTNMRTTTVKKMKMDYLTLSKIKPDLIYAAVTAYGSHGPDADKGGMDFQGQGRSGYMYAQGEPGTPPGVALFAVIDQATAVMASYQVIIALLMRHRFGIGQKVDVSLLGTASYLRYFNNLYSLITGQEISRYERAIADPLRNYYKCKDDKWIVQTHGENADARVWGQICELLDHPQLGSDPRYDTRQKRITHAGEIVSIFDKAFLTKTRDEWVRLFQEKNLVISAVNNTLEAVNDPQMFENGYVVNFDHPEVGTIRIPGFPISFSGAKINNTLLAPRLGEHTESILREIAGYTDADIAQLKKDGIV